MKLPEKFQSFQKTCHRTCPFLLSVSVKLCNNKINKMKPVFIWNCSFTRFSPYRHFLQGNGKESLTLQPTFNSTYKCTNFILNCCNISIKHVSHRSIFMSLFVLGFKTNSSKSAKIALVSPEVYRKNHSTAGNLAWNVETQKNVVPSEDLGP